jgi:hypothetical protein
LYFLEKVFLAALNGKSVSSCFSVFVVAKNRLYTTTTNGVWCQLRFSFSVRDGLLTGCGDFRKQNRTLDSIDRVGEVAHVMWFLFLIQPLSKLSTQHLTRRTNRQLLSKLNFSDCLVGGHFIINKNPQYLSRNSEALF